MLIEASPRHIVKDTIEMSTSLDYLILKKKKIVIGDFYFVEEGGEVRGLFTISWSFNSIYSKKLLGGVLPGEDAACPIYILFLPA